MRLRERKYYFSLFSFYFFIISEGNINEAENNLISPCGGVREGHRSTKIYFSLAYFIGDPLERAKDIYFTILYLCFLDFFNSFKI